MSMAMKRLARARFQFRVLRMAVSGQGVTKQWPHQKEYDPG